MIKIRLKVPKSARPANVPSPMTAPEPSGDPRPNRPVGKAGSATFLSVIPSSPSQNKGKYTPPPKSPIWTRIPVGVCKNCD
jgi:hypothetical protein